MRTLIIRHEPGSNPARFVVVRGSDSKSADPVEVSSPFAAAVEGRPESNLMAELAWYLEKFLDYPFEPRTVQAENILDALNQWGKQAYAALFGSGKACVWYEEAVKGGEANLCLQVMSDDATVLSWPWEALQAKERTYLSVSSLVERRMNKVTDAVVSKKLPRDIVNILLVTCRPHEGDVGYRSISRPLVELIEQRT